MNIDDYVLSQVTTTMNTVRMSGVTLYTNNSFPFTANAYFTREEINRFGTDEYMTSEIHDFGIELQDALVSNLKNEFDKLGLDSRWYDCDIDYSFRICRVTFTQINKTHKIVFPDVSFYLTGKIISFPDGIISGV